jgi:hypothetical protein
VGSNDEREEEEEEKNLCNPTVNQYVYSSSQFSNSGPIIN